MAGVSRVISIKVGNVQARAQLNDSHTAREIWKALPIEGVVSTWGDEVYFSVPVTLGEEDASELVSGGDLGYWPPGTAFCIFFGPTPMSRGDEIRPASPVNVFGRVLGDATVFKEVAPGARITVRQAEA